MADVSARSLKVVISVSMRRQVYISRTQSVLQQSVADGHAHCKIKMHACTHPCIHASKHAFTTYPESVVFGRVSTQRVPPYYGRHLRSGYVNKSLFVIGSTRSSVVPWFHPHTGAHPHRLRDLSTRARCHLPQFDPVAPPGQRRWTDAIFVQVVSTRISIDKTSPIV